MTQIIPDERVRLSPRVRRKVVRLAKSKAALQEITLEWVVEQLLEGWIAGRYALESNNKREKRNGA